ncbi:MAG: amino acid transporter [Planctomycetota bacterium]
MSTSSGDADQPVSQDSPVVDSEPVKPAPQPAGAGATFRARVVDLPPEANSGHQSFWLWVLCLTGVDYFSTLGYQPSIAFEATGRLAPLATVLLVLVTLFGALPVYCYVAGQSFHGQGSIAMLEKLLHGWGGKFLVLVLLGFAGTDFVITKTLSAADAAEHLIHNPLWQDMPLWLQGYSGQLILTMTLLVLLGGVFIRGFGEVIGIAVALVAVYLVLNAIVVIAGLNHLAGHPELIAAWWSDVEAGNWLLPEAPVQGPGWGAIIIVCLLFFPKLALGLSGFETGVAIMPMIRGDSSDSPHNPVGRIRNTRKLLILAAVIMSVYLLGSSMVVTMLIPPHELAEEGLAANRALAFLAHGQGPFSICPWFGNVFGTIYDISTVLILWFAGASAMSGLLNLVPRYLPRYGMAPEWATNFRAMVVLFTFINLAVTLVFRANVEAQGGAYATGVMMLISSASVATIVDQYRKRSGSKFRRISWPYVFIAAVFVYVTVMIVIEKPEGMAIASCFIVAVMISSLTSRLMRSTELRFVSFQFINHESHFLWDSLRHLEFPVLVPHRAGGTRSLAEKEELIRQMHHLDAAVPIVFIEASVGDASDFYHSPEMEITNEEGRFIIRVTKCVSIAHVLASIALELSKSGSPPELHFGWSDENPLTMNLGFVLFGEGNIPWLVRELITKAEPDPAKQPRVIIG